MEISEKVARHIWKDIEQVQKNQKGDCENE